ncbi:hypothetical protein [Georgenia ruanii]|uniref:hypothetical protein n=1 Tax=Georgenia ruanii TaxID=348442 RepID=UPI0012652944|nr:hypothetical protein [Georgenia ruanii]
METLTRPRDPRSQRTVSSLQRALASLARTTSPAHIDVTSLCRAAGVHRTTFYKHFDTVSGLALSLLTDLLEGADPPDVGYAAWLKATLARVAENRQTYRYLLTASGDPVLMRTVCNLLTARAQEAVAAATAEGHVPRMDERALGLALGFASYGLIEAVIADETLDVAGSVDALLASFPVPLGAVLVA